MSSLLIKSRYSGEEGSLTAQKRRSNSSTLRWRRATEKVSGVEGDTADSSKRQAEGEEDTEYNTTASPHTTTTTTREDRDRCRYTGTHSECRR